MKETNFTFNTVLKKMDKSVIINFFIDNFVEIFFSYFQNDKTYF